MINPILEWDFTSTLQVFITYVHSFHISYYQINVCFQWQTEMTHDLLSKLLNFCNFSGDMSVSILISFKEKNACQLHTKLWNQVISSDPFGSEILCYDVAKDNYKLTNSCLLLLIWTLLQHNTQSVLICSRVRTFHLKPIFL